MEPIPETTEALRLLARASDDDPERDMREAAALLKLRVSGLVGFSISVVEQDVTFTYLSSERSLAALDALQYLDGGPCEEAVHEGTTVTADHDDLLDEGRWQLFARAGAASGVASTLSLPLLEGSHVVGSVNIYGAEPGTFEGRHEELAALFGAWAPGAVTNADLSFTSRLRATEAVRRLEDLAVVDLAVGVLATAHGLAPDDARRRLHEAAARAGVPVLDVAHRLLDGASDAEGDQP